jgi:cyclopropane-fatty-acyl-phospholipid synthase
MAESASATNMRPPFEEIQAHYDISNDFFQLFHDPTRTYSCAYFKRDDMTLEEAQIAKIDLALGKLGLAPGMTLLDDGCGWGSTMKRALEKYDVNVVGLTLSKNQRSYTEQLLDDIDTTRSHRVLLRGWEEFDEPVDRIVSIEAFEAFGKPRYAPFFEMTYHVLSSGGRMALQTIFTHPPSYWPTVGIAITMSDLRFMRFIAQEIFPGGAVPSEEDVAQFSSGAGFSLAGVDHLSQYYARTLDSWSESLADHHDDAVRVTSQEVYDRYQRYLKGCSDFFQRGITEVGQFLFVKD